MFKLKSINYFGGKQSYYYVLSEHENILSFNLEFIRSVKLKGIFMIDKTSKKR